MNPPTHPDHPETPEHPVTTTLFPPPHLALVNALYAKGWDSAGPEPSALITGLTSIVFTAPVGELAVRIEAVGGVAMLALTGSTPHAAGASTRSGARWRALGPVLPAKMLEAIAQAAQDARRTDEAGTEIDKLIAELEPRGWVHTEEHSHDELLGSQLASPDGAVRITWGPDEEEYCITDRTANTAITADYATPLGVLRVMAGIDTPPHEAGGQSATGTNSADLLRRAREFGGAAQRLDEVVLTTPTTGAAAAAGRVGWSRTPLTVREFDDLLGLLADAATCISHAVTYIKTTAVAHGDTWDAAEPLSSVKHILNHAASTLRAVTTVSDEEDNGKPRATT